MGTATKRLQKTGSNVRQHERCAVESLLCDLLSRRLLGRLDGTSGRLDGTSGPQIPQNLLCTWMV